MCTCRQKSMEPGRWRELPQNLDKWTTWYDAKSDSCKPIMWKSVILTSTWLEPATLCFFYYYFATLLRSILRNCLPSFYQSHITGTSKLHFELSSTETNETNFTFVRLKSQSTVRGPFELPVEWQTTRTVPRLPSNLTITFSALINVISN